MLRKARDNFSWSRPYLIVTALSVILFFPTWLRLANIWLEFEQVLAHGLATALIFLGLLVIHPPRPLEPIVSLRRPLYLIGGLGLLITTLVWTLLELVRIDTLAYLMLPAGMMAVSWTLLGLPNTLRFLPYVLVLALSLPFWADLVPLLVSLASVVVGEWVRWFGMTALIEGSSITLPYGRLLIADGCSGIRYFAISILLAMMTAILNDYRWKGWLISVVVAMLLGLLANWVRITILVFVAYETDMQSELLTDHETMGWIVFAVFIFPALYFSPVRRRSDAAGIPESTAVFQKTGTAAVLAAFLLGPTALLLTQVTAAQQAPWTMDLANFQANRSFDDMPLPVALPDSLTNQIWKSGNLWVSVAQSQRANTDGKLVPYIPAMFDRSTWQVEERLEAGILVYRNILTRDRVLIDQWFQVGSRSSRNYREAKLLQIPATLSGEGRFALVTIQAPCIRNDCNQALTRTLEARASLRPQF